MPLSKMVLISSPNFGVRRSKIEKIIIHHTAAPSIESTIDWFKRPESQVSAHFVVGLDGKIVQMVDTARVAWHCYGHNAKSVGIEVVNVTGPMTEAQDKALTALVQMLLEQFKLGPLAVTGHRYIGDRPTVCPGEIFSNYGTVFDWARTKFGGKELV